MATIFVKATKPGTAGLWDRDPAHLNGEVFISGEMPVEVAKTAAVMKALGEGRIVEVEIPSVEPVQPVVTERPARRKG